MGNKLNQVTKNGDRVSELFALDHFLSFSKSTTSIEECPIAKERLLIRDELSKLGINISDRNKYYGLA
jgi:hypothetical protein